MIYVILGVALGLAVGFKMDILYNPVYAVYVALVILAIVNTISNIFCRNLKKEISNKRCVILLAVDLGLALLLGFVGEHLGLPLYLAAVFAFGNNIYANVKFAIDYIFEKKNI